MTASTASPISRWRYGIHPRAADARIRSLTRVDVPLGEALRLEMTSADENADDTVHIQYYIATELGPWALWLSCAREDLADREAAIQALTLPLTDE